MRTRFLSLALFALSMLPAACFTADGTSPERPQRIVAFADVHGDLDVTRRALRLAGAIDERDAWIGEDLIVVQTGDQLDRGDDEQEILELLARLGVEAEAAGGAVHVLLGNHELMNVAGDYRYVTPGGFADFEGAVEFDPADPDLVELEPLHRVRAAAFRPGGPFALLLAEHEVILVIEDSVFVHGGLHPEHVEYGVERINAETRAWLRGEGERPAILGGPQSPVWSRLYSYEPDEEAASTLAETLDMLGAERLVVGHTVQRSGIQNLCDGNVWCIDVGLASHYGGPLEVLLIEGDEVSILREAQVVVPR